MAIRTNFSELSDQELLIRIRDNADYLSIVYKRCKSNCLNFMRKMTIGSRNDYDMEDVFQDAILVLYEKIVGGNFELTASFQTYLNSVCRFQLLNMMKKDNKNVSYIDNLDSEDDESPFNYIATITDSLDENENPKEVQLIVIERALEKIKAAGGHCYELLTLFWYHRKSMNELTQHFAYSNADNTKSQKAKCQKRLQIIAFNEMNN